MRDVRDEYYNLVENEIKSRCKKEYYFNRMIVNFSPTYTTNIFKEIEPVLDRLESLAVSEQEKVFFGKAKTIFCLYGMITVELCGMYLLATNNSAKTIISVLDKVDSLISRQFVNCYGDVATNYDAFLIIPLKKIGAAIK